MSDDQDLGFDEFAAEPQDSLHPAELDSLDLTNSGGDPWQDDTAPFGASAATEQHDDDQVLQRWLRRRRGRDLAEANLLDAQRVEPVNPPVEETENFSRFAQRAYANRFSETDPLRDLWNRARFHDGDDPPLSREGFGRVRDRFWELVRDPSDEDGKAVKAILEAAGFDVTGSGAPKLRDDLLQAESRDPSDDAYRSISDRLLHETGIDRRGKQLTEPQRQIRDTAERSLDIDHADPAARAAKDAAHPDPEKWLDAANLQFMFGDDNRWHKGDRYRI